jgi:hypothetical protein
MADRDEIEREFRRYYTTGPVMEDWVGWAHLFTDDATYFDHYYGTFTGPGEVAPYLEGTMGAAPMVYTVLKWYVIDGDRVHHPSTSRPTRSSTMPAAANGAGKKTSGSWAR